jgi:hypothetical protein
MMVAMSEPATGTDKALRERLVRRAARDQKVRDPARFKGPTPSGAGIISLLRGLHFLWVDRRNTAWLDRVVRARGWPAITAVGREAAHAAWLLAQHADRRPHTQRRFLLVMREAAERGEAERKYLAYLEDRVRVNAGRPQLYGTQYTMTGEGFGPRPIEDPDGLDDRRADVGLPPMSEYDASMRRIPEGGPPAPSNRLGRLIKRLR